MSQFLAYILLLPLILWSTFQGLLYWNATNIQESLNLAVYKGTKEASIQGHFDQSIYDDMKNFLVDNYHYDPSKIQIKGTETITERGGYLDIKITIPKPMINVVDIFKLNDSKPFVVEKSVMSEYVP